MRNRVLPILVLAILVLSWLPPSGVAQAAVAAPSLPKGESPAGLLKPDGTLMLDGSFSGSFNLSGWNVQMDPQRGPVFNPKPDGEVGVQATDVASSWSSLGMGGYALDGLVYAVAVSGNKVYVGGSFQNADNISAADYIAMWDGTRWFALGQGWNGSGVINGNVLALAVSGPNLYVGGNFTDVDSENSGAFNIDYLAEWDGTNWHSLGGDVYLMDGSLNGQVNAIVVNGADVYVGGAFTDVNNRGTVLTAADYVAKWNGTAPNAAGWSALGSNGPAGNGSLTKPVYALAVSGSNLYVGGAFINVNNNGTVLNAADYLAVYAGGQWSALGSTASGGGSLNGLVQAIAVSGSNVYVGGEFTNVVQGQYSLAAADYVAKWNGSSWSALGKGNYAITGVDGSLNHQVTSLAVVGTNVYVGGWFSNVNENGRTLAGADYLAKWSETTSSWSALGEDGAGNGALSSGVLALALAMGSSNLYVGGYFSQVHDGSSLVPSANRAAIWNGAHWSGLSAIPTTGSINNTVDAIAVSGTDVYIGGEFTDLNNNGTLLTAADYVAKWDGTNWSALGSDGANNGSLDCRVDAIAINGPDVYVGGCFENVNNNGAPLPTADKIAKWDGTNWSAMGSNGSGDGALSSEVFALAVAANGADLFVGGMFTSAANIPEADYIARWNGTNWFALGGDGNGEGSLSSQVYSLAVSGTDLYVGGFFQNVNNNGTILKSADYIAKWDGVNWSGLGHGASVDDGSLNYSVDAIAISGQTVYAGGDFTDVNNKGSVLQAADHVAKWDGTNWSALSHGVDASTGSVAGSVTSLAMLGTDLIVGGNFEDVNDNGSPLATMDYIARWNGTNWLQLSSNGAGDGSLNGSVKALTVSSGKLYVGGNFVDVSSGGTVLSLADFIAAYGIPDLTPPVVTSITCAGSSPTSSTSIAFNVVFSKPVSGVDAADFTLMTNGLSGPAISAVSGAGNLYLVTVTTGTGSTGSVRLDLADNDSIVDQSNNHLGGAGTGNGSYSSGETYVIDRLQWFFLPLAVKK
jgi:trimeric autotransporter adhesin